MKKPSLLLLILFLSFGTIGAVLFTPSIPNLARFFSISPYTAQLTVTVYLIGYAICQLIYGPLANRYGRKQTLRIGITIAAIGYILAAFSRYIHLYSILLVARFVQSLGASAALCLTFTIIKDYFDPKEARKVVAIVTTSFAAIPGIAIAIGGVLTEYLGWEYCFYFLTLYSAFIFLLTYLLPPSVKEIDRSATKPINIIYRYIEVFRHVPMLTFATLIGCTTAVFYIFSSTAPFIGISLLHINPSIYGYLSLIPAGGYFIGNCIASVTNHRFHAFRSLFIGMSLICVAIFVIFFLFNLRILNRYSLFIPTAFLYMGIPFIYSNCSILSSEHLHDKASASSAMSFLNMGTSFIGVMIIELIHSEPVRAMPRVFLSIYVVMGFLLYFGYKSYQKCEKEKKRRHP